MTDAAPPRWQFSLRTALVAMLASATCFWWFSGPESRDVWLASDWNAAEPNSNVFLVRVRYRLSGAAVVVAGADEFFLASGARAYAVFLTWPQEWLLDVGVVATVLLIAGTVIIVPLWWRKRRMRSSGKDGVA